MPYTIRPERWADLPHGELIRDDVQQRLDSWWPRLFGYHLLKLGPLSAELNSLASSISHQCSLFQGECANIEGEYTSLPLRNSSIDATLLTMLLEFEGDPYRILREADRILVSGGHLLIIGVNPLSPAVLGKLLPKYQSKLPWCGHFFTPSRVKDWLGLLGYQVVADERMVFHPLLGKMEEQTIWQHTLEAWLPSAGSFYLLVARKLDSPLTPVRQKRRSRQPKWSTAPSAGRMGKSSS